MDQDTTRELFGEARVAVLSTVTSDGHPHVVPCCFVLDDSIAYSAVDAKAKSTLALKRLKNIRANENLSLLVHRYDEDWSTLWWVRADGIGRVVDSARQREHALSLLGSKYPQYLEAPPIGDVLEIEIDHWRSWP